MVAEKHAKKGGLWTMRFKVFLGLLLTLYLTAGRPASATTAAPVTVDCPVCGTKVSAVEIMSTNNFGGVDRDLLRRAAGSQPILLLPTTCPTCHFSAYPSGFKEKVADDVKKAILSGALHVPAHGEAVPDVEMGKVAKLPAWVRHDLIGQVLALEKVSNDRQSWAALSASWAVRLEAWPFTSIMPDDATADRIVKAVKAPKSENRAQQQVLLGRALLADRSSGDDHRAALIIGASLLRAHGENPEVLAVLPTLLPLLPEAQRATLEKDVKASIDLERVYQRRALELLTARLKEKFGKNDDQAAVTYVCGELNRRLGNNAEALRYYDLALSVEGAPAGLVDWIKEQRALVAPK